mgnify:CR=1 FL=1
MPVNALFSFLIKKRLQQIDLFRSNPHEAQLEVFHKLINDARYTEWGRQHGYSDITTPDQFRERVRGAGSPGDLEAVLREELGLG